MKIKRSKGIKTMVFSGNIKSRVQFIEERYHFLQNFDNTVFSYECGYSKPSEEFVDAMIQKAGCPPDQIVYIDDLLSDAKPAIPKGVHVLIYNTGEISKLRIQLHELGVL